MASFTFVHAADLHLGSPFRQLSALEPGIGSVLRKATYEALDNLVDLCVRNEAAFLVLAGDVFDWEDRSLAATLKFRDAMEKLSLAGVRVFAAHGNHDPLEGGHAAVEIPSNVHVFGHEAVETLEVAREGARLAAVSGISYRNRAEPRNLVSLFPDERPAPFHVGVVHANVGSDTGHENYAPAVLSDLAAKPVDYFALGHVHTRAILCERPHAAYPGNTQGLSFRETGPRGALVVRVEGNEVAGCDFHATDAARYETATVSITGIEQADALEKGLFSVLSSLREAAENRPLLARVILSGRGPLYGDLAAGDAKDALLQRAREFFSGQTPFLWVEDIRNRTLPEADLEKRRSGQDILAQALQIARDLREDSEAFREEARAALAELFDNSRASRLVEPLSEAELAEALEQAELLAFDLLEGGNG